MEEPCNKKAKLEEGNVLDGEIIRFDGWLIAEEEHQHDNDDAYSFVILGTSARDDSAKPHVLSPLVMEAMRGFLPYVISEENYWMKFSLIRDVSYCSLLDWIPQWKCPVDVHDQVNSCF